ncbi:MAG: hypothetical protein M0R80_04065 [Proteobacteria bacterium]|jgi:hypothetical protein|nr:hypothetical protein [Pseudomonadota bacterium]
MPTRKESFSTVIETCCHHVKIAYWDIEQELTEDLKESLTEHGEERAKERINNDCSSGELNCYYVDHDGNDEEIRGWWKIITEED